MSNFCQNCGSVVDDTAKFCTTCGFDLGNSAAQGQPQQASTVNPSAAQPAQAVSAPASGSVPGWKTSVGLSILGIVVAAMFNGFVNNGTGDSANSLGGLLSLAYLVCSIVYALAFYPKYFNNQKVENAQLTSFLNCFFGGIIFGCIWNSNLTKNHKGISHIVFVVLVPCLVVVAVALITAGLLAYSVTL